MDSKELQELIEIISRSDFSTFELERDDIKLRLVRETAPPAAPTSTAGPAHEPLPPASSPEPAVAMPQAEHAADGLVPLTSPIVGTFYRAPSPGADPFVRVGDRVKKGQVLCIVEAMKVMNEIESEMDAEVAEILVADAQPVEYGEVLFKLRPR